MCSIQKSQRRPGFTLIEMLVVIAIIGILSGLITIAVQQVRISALNTTCMNNLQQIGAAMTLRHDLNAKLPPGIGWYPGAPAAPNAPGTGGWGSWAFHLLPDIGEELLYRKSMTTQPNTAGQQPQPPGTPYNSGEASMGTSTYVGTKVIKLYQCPADPSIKSHGLYQDSVYKALWGSSSYAANYLILCKVDNSYQPVGTFLESYQGTGPRLLESSIPDGTSNTILVAEKYAQCETTQFGGIARGCMWDWWEANGWYVYHPLFAGDVWWGTGIGPESKFQVRPFPFTQEAGGVCDPARTATGHTNGMQVLLADMHVKTLAASMSADTWWAACTPNSEDDLGPDWNW